MPENPRTPQTTADHPRTAKKTADHHRIQTCVYTLFDTVPLMDTK